jgi:DNA-binding NarL/FixJ family response regulator
MASKIITVLVDDNKTFLDGLADLFSLQDKYQVIGTLLSGDDLLTFLKENHVDLVIMDLEMPGLNGVETAKIVNFLYQHIKLVGISMHSEKVYLEEFIGVGYKAFVCKPKIVEEIFNVMDDVMDDKYVFSLKQDNL